MILVVSAALIDPPGTPSADARGLEPAIVPPMSSLKPWHLVVFLIVLAVLAGVGYLVAAARREYRKP